MSSTLCEERLLHVSSPKCDHCLVMYHVAQKAAPLKLADKLWWELCQILTHFRNSFNAGKRTKLPINLLQYNHPYLKHVATLPCEMQHAKLSQIMQQSFCKTLQFLDRFSKKNFTVVNRIFSLPTCFFNFRFRLNILHLQQKAYVNNVTINIIAKSLKTCEKPKWCLLCEDKELQKIYLLNGCQPVKLMTEFPEKNWKLSGLDKLLKKLCETGSAEWGPDDFDF